MATSSPTITVVFPNDDDAKYDIGYYTNHHMPLIASKWGKYGIKGWSVTKFGPGADGSAPLYAFGSTVHWKDSQSITNAFSGPETGEIMSDIPNFSNKHPVFLYGEEVKNVVL
ncbi:hypothetical protein B0O99DRAFT_606343 [Bisporella sp. PMI_857]|nr:hypothetical protein B0O99DRAFT_606343 [Bisporella sp. PMI_857]